MSVCVIDFHGSKWLRNPFAVDCRDLVGLGMTFFFPELNIISDAPGVNFRTWANFKTHIYIYTYVYIRACGCQNWGLPRPRAFYYKQCKAV